ncbi:hypothetical protein NDU88_008841 [Pleurodeles waltl]|uniref:Uncharacterized protein n=1 Tax=Pleurodeles waltl TaxID=8319 RepID=A0AAV7N8H6_PLEWA|nr:hypothetical protein NDU88_008841 [Pleurodeles waltl]
MCDRRPLPPESNQLVLPRNVAAVQLTDPLGVLPPCQLLQSSNLTMAYYADGDEQYQELQEIPVEQQMEERLMEALGYHVQDSARAANNLAHILVTLEGLQASLFNAPEVLPPKKYWRRWRPQCCAITNMGLPPLKMLLSTRPKQAFMYLPHPSQSQMTRKRSPFRVINCGNQDIPRLT